MPSIQNLNAISNKRNSKEEKVNTDGPVPGV